MGSSLEQSPVPSSSPRSPPLTDSKRAAPFDNLHTREYVGHKKKVHSVAWNCTGRKLASGSVDQTARIWHIEPHSHHNKVKEMELKGHADSVDQLCWDPKHADVLATASGDKTVRLWDVRTGKCSQQVELSGENINITFKPDGTHIAVGNRDDELTIIDVRKFKAINKRKFPYEVNEMAWNTTGELFFLTTGNGTVDILSYPSLATLQSICAHTAGCYCIAIDPTGRYFAVGSADALVSLWDLSEMLCVRTFTKLEWPVRTISFNHDGKYIASASEDLFIDIAEVESARSVYQIPCRAAMNSVEWNPKYNLLAFAGDDKNKYSVDEETAFLYGLFLSCFGMFLPCFGTLSSHQRHVDTSSDRASEIETSTAEEDYTTYGGYVRGFGSPWHAMRDARSGY